MRFDEASNSERDFFAASAEILHEIQGSRIPARRIRRDGDTSDEIDARHSLNALPVRRCSRYAHDERLL